MDPAIVSALIGLGGALVGGGLTSGVTYITARSERDKFARDKLWEERRASYTSILNKLSACERAADTVNRGFNDGPPGSGYDYHGGAAYRTDVSDLRAKHRALVNAINSNQLVATRTMADRVDRLTFDIAALEQDDLLPPEDAERTWEIYAEAEKDVRRIGKQDLGFPDS